MKAQNSVPTRTLMYKGVNLLSYEGPCDDYAAVGRFLAQSILTKEERLTTCWLGQRSNHNFADRTLASAEDEADFKGLIF